MSYAKLGKEWTDVLLQHDEFVNNIEKKMVDGVTPDDILMAIVGVIANICQEAECASYIERMLYLNVRALLACAVSLPGKGVRLRVHRPVALLNLLLHLSWCRAGEDTEWRGGAHQTFGTHQRP